MAEITAKLVAELRKRSGAGMLDCKKALEENDGDVEAAIVWLREKGITKSAERSDRDNAQGAVAVAVTDGGAAIVQLKCETDFVAKSPDFKALVQELANLVADKGEDAAETKKDTIDDLKVTLKENIELGQVVRFERKDGNLLDSYLHVQSERGVNAVLIETEGVSQEVAHDVAMHIGFTRARYLSRDEVPAEAIEAEKQILLNTAANEGKELNEKALSGRLDAFIQKDVLVDQKFAKDESQRVGKVLGDGKVVRFAQVVVG